MAIGGSQGNPSETQMGDIAVDCPIIFLLAIFTTKRPFQGPDRAKQPKIPSAFVSCELG